MTLKDAAHIYLKDGWSVIPLKPGLKKPAISWREYIDRKPTKKEVEQWWTDMPDANIGLITGAISGVCVVDVDGVDPKPIYEEAPCEAIQKTPRGWHLVYRYPGHPVLTRAGVRDGVDVRGDGGYIVGAPSVVGGVEYSWLGKHDTPEVHNLTQPPALVSGANPFDPESGKEEVSQPGVPLDKWVTEMFENGAPKGIRNQSAARLAGYLAAKGLPEDIANSILKGWNQNKNEDPDSMPESEINSTVQSIYRKEGPKNGKDHGSVSSTKFETVPYDQYAKEHARHETHWLIEDWLPRDTINLTVAPPGSYKTWFLIEALVAIASGHNFLGKWKVNNPGPVVLIQQEDNHSTIVSRINKVLWTSHHSNFNFNTTQVGDLFSAPVIPKGLPIHIYPDRSLRFDNQPMVDSFVEAMYKIKPRAVFIDPLYTAVPMDGYMANAVEHMMVLKTLRDQLPCSFIIAHHTKKSDEEGRKKQAEGIAERMDVWGSQFLNAFLETGWQIRPTGRRGAVKVRRHYKDTEDSPEISLEWTITDDWVKTKPTTEGMSKEVQQDFDQVIKYLNARGPASGRKIAQGIKRSRNTVMPMLRQMAMLGMIVEKEGNKWEVNTMMEDKEPAQKTLSETLDAH